MAPANPRQEWKLPELAEEAGVSARTVRYYVQRGLLPAPAFKGRDTVYGPEHLTRLKAIKRLQERFLPLDAIQVELARLSPAELEALAEGKDGGGPTPPMRPLIAAAPVAPGVPHGRHLPRPARWERWELLPGLELHLSDQADARTRELAEWLRTQAEKDFNGGHHD